MSRNCDVINSRTRAKKLQLLIGKHFLTWMMMTLVSHVSKMRKGPSTGPVLQIARHGSRFTTQRVQRLTQKSPQFKCGACPGFILTAVIKYPDMKQFRGKGLILSCILGYSPSFPGIQGGGMQLVASQAREQKRKADYMHIYCSAHCLYSYTG